jgi:hypothetical protein
MQRLLAIALVTVLIACQQDAPTAIDAPLLDVVAESVELAPGFTVYFDEATFLAVSQAQLTVTYPAVTPIWTVPYVENGVSLAQADGCNHGVAERTPIFDGYEFACSCEENVDVAFQNVVRSYGLWMQDGYEVGFINWPYPLDSQFEFTFFDPDDNVIGAILVDPPVDEAYFLGAVARADTIARIEIREFTAVPGNPENDFYSIMYTSALPPLPQTKADCRGGAWKMLGFKNGGACNKVVTWETP